MTTKVLNLDRKCSNCYFWNRHDLTYISPDLDCCAYWHIAYYRTHLLGDRINKKCFKPKTKNVQLTLF